jgi:topoisomerase-4 subunit A
VIGKFHPHGDSACYEAMVLMAQPFSYRYPLIDGQGNWGSPDDPKSFAAMRYTESQADAVCRSAARRARPGHGGLGAELRRHAGGAEDGCRRACRNVLLNGTTGIAVGMATDIPPHNLREVASACIRLLDDPEATTDLCEHIKGPDFPTEAEIITPRADLIAMYENRQRLGPRARRVHARGRRHRDHRAAAPGLRSQGAGADRRADAAKKLPMVEDLRDESDHENPTRSSSCRAPTASMSTS